MKELEAKGVSSETDALAAKVANSLGSATPPLSRSNSVRPDTPSTLVQGTAGMIAGSKVSGNIKSSP